MKLTATELSKEPLMAVHPPIETAARNDMHYALHETDGVCFSCDRPTCDAYTRNCMRAQLLKEKYGVYRHDVTLRGEPVPRTGKQDVGFSDTRYALLPILTL